MIIKPKQRIKFEEEIEEAEIKVEEDIVKSIDVNYITSILMQAKVNFHILHFQTKSNAKHLALGDLYEGVTRLADDIIECLLGRLSMRLIQGLTITCSPLNMPETDQNITDQVNFLFNFSEELFTFGNDNNYQDIANLASELMQLINKTKYRLTLF